ncbi:hydroxylamine reductase [Marinilabilia salmonicolor]|uniref:Hydroxylamine reductase n=1 Tax=Marinilabilia salmonicolor TaxID=989 RepID=A0A2T0XMF7_9BACT|nr:hydroxylamine reductase [Marinilabilia salmonicolor]PRZ00128.1 hydroxylamine reductase [Marinilabilia salmonicolor]RCW38754.1 hydroxylamine reductase [Marinilabilia salmonicolor]
MSMFCYQCQEASKGTGCEIKGVCGKTSDVANLQDLLLFVTKGVAWWSQKADEAGIINPVAEKYIIDSMFITITNANFDRNKIIAQIKKGFEVQDSLAEKLGKTPENTPECAIWRTDSEEAMEEKSTSVGVLSHKNEDIRSLKELLTYGMKGIAAYAEHAHNLGYHNAEVNAFMKKGLVATVDETLEVDELLPLVLECGKYGVEVMSLLDKANTESYGHPEITSVNLGVGKNPGILVSGHDLKDFEELLKQTEGTGIDIYTHSEMLPANYYPAFKKYKHFIGNYGNSWWAQTKEFESFNGPVLLTTNCLVPPKESYKERVYTTGAAGFDGCTHIPERKDGQPKDFSVLIEHARKCQAPTEIETGEIVGGFAHNQVMALADKVVDAVKSGAIKKFVVMAGCDGRVSSRSYYTDFAQELPEDSVILTAGCAKYRYNKLKLGDIGGIPRILDAGQCNDSYSLAVIALKLKEVFGLEDINELPIVYNIAWYEQKAVIVLLALLSLGVKNIHLGPTLPAFLSPNVAKVLVEQFGIGSISTVEQDMAEMMA